MSRLSAGQLIDLAGLKGTSIGKATVSYKHANFIVTEKGVLAADYLALIRQIQETVWQKFAIHLEPEIELLGFDEE